MMRKIIQISEERCTGCGKCAEACHENAIGMVDGRARLLREDYCDGLGDCLPQCPAAAITIIELEAAVYDAAAVTEHRDRLSLQKPLIPEAEAKPELRSWPIQLKLAPVQAAYYAGADLLLAADCTAYAYAAFHADFIRGRAALIGCPKLDRVDYSEKLTAILKENDIQSVLVVRMEVPCCGGLEMAFMRALTDSGRHLPWQVVTLGTDGRILDRSVEGGHFHG